MAETVNFAQKALREGKCVVIGLQSTGESRMSEIVKEKGPDLDDFASGVTLVTALIGGFLQDEA